MFGDLTVEMSERMAGRQSLPEPLQAKPSDGNSQVAIEMIYGKLTDPMGLSILWFIEPSAEKYA